MKRNKDFRALVLAIIVGVVVMALFYKFYRPEQVITVPLETSSYYVTYPDTRTPQPDIPTTEVFKPYPVPLDINIQWYINAQCKAKGIPTILVLALIWQESRYQADVISATNDYGLMQVNACNKAEVERVLNVTNLLDPYQNCKAGLYILDRCIEQTDTLDKALMIYNLGESGAQAQWQKGFYSTEFSRSVIHKMNELER